MEESHDPLSDDDEPLGGDGPRFWLSIRLSSNQIPKTLENMFDILEKVIKERVPSSKDPSSTFHRVLLSQCQATEAPISWRAGNHKGYVNWGRLHGEIRRSSGAGMNICVNTYEGFSVNAMGIREILNHWTEGVIHFVQGGGTVKSFEIICSDGNYRSDHGVMIPRWEKCLKDGRTG